MPHSSRGLTLIELLVAVAIFTVVMLMSVSALVALLDVNQVTRNQSVVAGSINVVMESLTRTIRAGSNFHCAESGSVTTQADCPASGSSRFALEPRGGDPVAASDQVVFRLSEVAGQGTVERSDDGGSTWVPMTGEDVDVNTLTFRQVSLGGGTEQPRFLIALEGVAGAPDGTEQPFTVQTTVAQQLSISAPIVLGAGTSSNPKCTIPTGPGRDFVDLTASKTVEFMLWGGSEATSCSNPVPSGWPARRRDMDTWPRMFDPPHPIDVDLAPGQYNVYLELWDNHVPGCDTTYVHVEQWPERAYAQFYYDHDANPGTPDVPFTPTTTDQRVDPAFTERIGDDIPLMSCNTITQVGTNVDFPAGLSSTTGLRINLMTVGDGGECNMAQHAYVTGVFGGGTPEDITTPGSCSDGLDNDNDGLIDAGDNGDPGCTGDSGIPGNDTLSLIPVCVVFEQVGSSGGAVDILEF
ncbi:prepilin-type N-terminal cleavage/methylation domain-containing protein [Patescibacteria group bacterium]|jgi:prepilin-type N-terminal cleavage/methylation domain-containing protein|nr:prepilin-type N-terminal cleavage/methylation domain-containing protein [Patescibacteria group bacterium]